MNTQKLLVIVASVCLMAFFNVSSFAQNAPVQPALTGSMAEVLARSLAAQGYEVGLDGSSLTITTSGGELSLDLSATGEESEDSGIQARLVPPADAYAEDPAEDETDPEKLQLCLNAADLNFNVTTALCELYVKDFPQFICKIEATTDRILSSLKCIALYVDPPPPSGDVVSVFVTKESYQANFGGLAGADAECQAAAEAAGLSGTDWTAWLSDSTENAIDRIPDGQYRLVDGITQVANDKTDLTTGTLKAAISLDEFGQTVNPLKGLVWTGTKPDGTGTGNNCNNWTDHSSESVMDMGFADQKDDPWTLYEWGPVPCNIYGLLQLYCFGGVE